MILKRPQNIKNTDMANIYTSKPGYGDDTSVRVCPDDSGAMAAALELRRSLNLLILSVTFGMAFFTVISGPPLTGFIRMLGSGNTVYALIMAMPIVGTMVQVFGSYIMENSGSRKTIFIVSGLIQRLIWIPIAFIPLIIKTEPGAIQIWIVIVLMFASSASGSFNSISFNSWIGSIIPFEIRGRFFGKRAMIYTISSVVSAMASGKFLDSVPGSQGYMILFSVVAVLGATDILIFLWIKDPPMKLSEKRIPIIKLLAEPFKDHNYMHFIAFLAAWNFGTNFSGPFFMLYMLEHLKTSFFATTLLTQVVSGVSTILFIRMMGGLVDKHGSKKMMRTCGLIIVSLPLLWLFTTPSNYYIIIFINFLGGILWPCFEITTINLSIWLAPEKNRSIYIAVYTLIAIAISVLTANIFGGLFMDAAGPLLAKLNINFIFGQKLSNFHLLFILSALFRLGSIIFLMKGFNEIS